MIQKHTFFSLDFILLYVCLILIGWMMSSYYIDSTIDTSNATTLRVRAGYEVREYEPGVMIGRKVSGASFAMWSDVARLKKDLTARSIEYTPYPFYLKTDDNGSVSAFFVVQKGSSVADTTGFELSPPLQNVAFTEFLWYPTEGKRAYYKAHIEKALEADGTTYDKQTYWTEVKDPWYVIPFMMHNGVFVRILPENVE